MNPSSDQGRSSEGLSWRFIALAAVLFAAAVGGMYWFSSKPAATPDTNNPAAAVETFDIAKARLETQDLQQRAMTAIGSRQDVDLLPQAIALTDRYPRFAPAHTLVAQLHIHKSQFKEAYDALERSLRLDSQQSAIQQLAGTVAQALGMHDKAADHFAQAVGMEPANGRYRVFLAQSLVQQQRFDEARMALLHALQIDSQLHEAYYALSTLDAKQGKLMPAITQAGRAIDHLPENDPQAPREQYIRWQAKLLQRDNRPAEALQVLGKLTPKERLSPAVIEDMAIAWQMLGQPVKGALLYEDALAQKADQWPLALGAARWYLKADDKPNARRMTAALARINPDAPALKDLNEQLK